MDCRKFRGFSPDSSSLTPVQERLCPRRGAREVESIRLLVQRERERAKTRRNLTPAAAKRNLNQNGAPGVRRICMFHVWRAQRWHIVGLLHSLCCWIWKEVLSLSLCLSHSHLVRRNYEDVYARACGRGVRGFAFGSRLCGKFGSRPGETFLCRGLSLRGRRRACP